MRTPAAASPAMPALISRPDRWRILAVPAAVISLGAMARTPAATAVTALRSVRLPMQPAAPRWRRAPISRSEAARMPAVPAAAIWRPDQARTPVALLAQTLPLGLRPMPAQRHWHCQLQYCDR